MSAATFSLKTLLLLVTVSAVGCYALVQHTPLWASIVLTLTYGLLSIAVVLALVRRGSARAFWAGFAAAGWVYLVMALSPLLFAGAPTLMTTKALIAGWQYVGSPVPRPTDDSSSPYRSSLSDRDLSDLESEYNDLMMSFGWSSDPERRDYVAAVRAYLQTGQALWSLAWGFVVGMLAAFFSWRERRKDRAAAAASNAP